MAVSSIDGAGGGSQVHGGLGSVGSQVDSSFGFGGSGNGGGSGGKSYLVSCLL